MDLATFLGLLMSFLLIFAAMGISAEGVSAFDRLLTFVDIPSFLIVFGGTFGAALTNSPLQGVTNLGRILKKAFFASSVNTTTIVDEFTDYANKARREGLLALEGPASSISDPYMRKGMQLTIDGLEPQMIEQIMSSELDSLEERHSSGIEVINSLASYAPALGMIGTVIGLVQMLKSMNDPSTIGPSMAIALITTFYGVVLANLVFLPLAGKLKTRSREEIRLKEMQLAGILALAKGENPRLIYEKLSSFQAPKHRRRTD